MKVDAEALTIGELRVVLALAGEVGKDLDHVADIADQDKGRPAIACGKAAGVIHRLRLGIEHQGIPGLARAPPAARRGIGIKFLSLGCRCGIKAALLGFKHEAAMLVEIDPAATMAAFAIGLVDQTLEHIGVQLAVRTRRVRPGDADDVAQLRQEQHVIGTLLSASLIAPAGDEAVNRLLAHRRKPRRPRRYSQLRITAIEAFNRRKNRSSGDDFSRRH